MIIEVIYYKKLHVSYMKYFLVPLQTMKASKGAMHSSNNSPIQDDKNPDVVPLGKGECVCVFYASLPFTLFAFISINNVKII